SSVPRFWRIYLALWLISRWRLPATPCLILPVAVILKRFFTPLLVFILGIFVSFNRDTSNQPWQPLWPDRQMNHVSVKRAPISTGARKGKGGRGDRQGGGQGWPCAPPIASSTSSSRAGSPSASTSPAEPA